SGDVFKRNAAKLAGVVSSHAASNQSMDFQGFLMRATMDSIFTIAFGQDLNTLDGSGEGAASPRRSTTPASSPCSATSTRSGSCRGSSTSAPRRCSRRGSRSSTGSCTSSSVTGPTSSPTPRHTTLIRGRIS
ncbi:hypothetical protein EE612_052389, partial [Oryza sativa]